MLKAYNVNKDPKNKTKETNVKMEMGMRGNREEKQYAWVYYRHGIQQHKYNTFHRVPQMRQNLSTTAEHRKD